MLTPSQENVLQGLNDRLLAEHAAACVVAKSKGQRSPPEPVLLTSIQVEYPKYLHKDWKATDKAIGHHEAGQSRLARNAEEEEALRADGYGDGPPKKDAAKKGEAPKKQDAAK